MRQKILVAVDGSENSLKAVAHVGDILRGSTESEVTLFHVVHTPPRLLEHAGPGDLKEFDRASASWEEASQRRVETEIFAPSKRILVERGLREELIVVRTDRAETDSGVAPAILREVKAQGYSAVVLGRRGRSMLMDFVLGSVASKLVHHVRGCAVWIVE